MAFLSSSEMNTHLYTENVQVITRGDDTITQAAIDAAVSEAKGYLSAYDINTIFAATGSDRNTLLLTFVKDIAAWHLIVLCNAGTETTFRQDRYNRAISWLKAVQKGDIAADLPKAKDADGNATGDPIVYGSNDKRNQHF